MQILGKVFFGLVLFAVVVLGMSKLAWETSGGEVTYFNQNGVYGSQTDWPDGEVTLMFYVTDEFARAHGWSESQIRISAIKKAGTSEFRMYSAAYAIGDNHQNFPMWDLSADNPSVKGWLERLMVLIEASKG